MVFNTSDVGDCLSLYINMYIHIEQVCIHICGLTSMRVFVSMLAF